MTLVTSITRHEMWNNALKSTEMQFRRSISEVENFNEDICITEPITIEEIAENLNKFDQVVISYVLPALEVSSFNNVESTLQVSLESCLCTISKLIKIFKKNRTKISLVNLEELSLISKQNKSLVEELGWKISNSVEKQKSNLNTEYLDRAIKEFKELYCAQIELLSCTKRISNKSKYFSSYELIENEDNNPKAKQHLIEQLFLLQNEYELLYREKLKYSQNINKLKIRSKNLEDDKQILLDQVFSIQCEMEKNYNKLIQTEWNFLEGEEVKSSLLNDLKFLEFKYKAAEATLRRIKRNPICRFLWLCESLIDKFKRNSIKENNLKNDVALLYNSKFFNVKWYLETYKDVEKSGIDPATHYLRFGAFEGRDPSRKFCTSWYISKYPDIKIDKINPLIHFIKFGQTENRIPVPNYKKEKSGK